MLRKFTNYQIETAIKVLMESSIVKNWVQAHAEFLGVDPDTETGKRFYAKQIRAAAERLIK